MKKFNIGEIIVILASIIVIAICLCNLGYFNRIIYGARFNEKRKEVGLCALDESWKREAIRPLEINDWWSNTVEKKQGLYCFYKRLSFVRGSLEIEMDEWKYTEGDSIDLLLLYTYYFNPKSSLYWNPDHNNHVFIDTQDKTQFLVRHGQSLENWPAFKRTLDFLAGREDSLQHTPK
jgi:hypothetical protein